MKTFASDTVLRGKKFQVNSPLSSEASRLVVRFAGRLADAARERPILDAPCGSGRNAVPLLKLGCSVICVDRDLSGLQARIASQPGNDWSRVDCRQIDFLIDTWPFQKGSVGGVVNVHHFSASLIPLLVHTLAPGGYLLIETISGRGGNYLELPKRGEIRAALGRLFTLEVYEEKSTGPKELDTVTLRLLARKA
jgi:SAM-dependent methyltransferase